MVNGYTRETYGVDHIARKCDCGDHEWRHEGNELEYCKHVKAIRNWVREND